MLKKILLGTSFAIVVAAGLGIGVYSLSGERTDSAAPDTAVNSLPDVTEEAAESSVPSTSEDPGDPWQASGLIVGLDDFGLTLSTETQGDVYIELGPPDFWQTQGILLEVGQTVTVRGFSNDGQIHAVEVRLQDGSTLRVRTEEGSPLWAGGPENSQQDGDHVPDPQVQVDEWVTIRGTITAMRGANITMVTTEDEVVTFQAGQPRFFASQGVNIAIGDSVEVLGFWQDNRFTAGQITQTATGAIVMLRDPNGRPLWAGSGNGGN